MVYIMSILGAFCSSIGQYTSNINISLYQGIKFVPVTLLKMPLYCYFINYIFLWLRGVREIVNRVANT